MVKRELSMDKAMRMKYLIIALSAMFIVSMKSPATANESTPCFQFFSEKNWVNAHEHCLREANLGELKAQKNIALLFHTGRSGQKNLRHALKWYLAAAKQEDVNSQEVVGMLYYAGTGVPQNYLQAHVWSNIAASNGSNSAAQTRRDAEHWMTPEQIAEAQARAQRCLESNYADC